MIALCRRHREACVCCCGRDRFPPSNGTRAILSEAKRGRGRLLIAVPQTREYLLPGRTLNVTAEYPYLVLHDDY